MMITTSNLNRVLTTEELASKAPVIFATEPTAQMSERYVFIPTSKLIEDMEQEGWKPVLATTKGKRRNAKKHSSFHTIAFENDAPQYLINDAETGELDCRVRIVVSNSHDGSSSFTFRVGIFRMICENGLVISTSEFSAISIRHVNYSLEQLRETISTITANIPKQIEAMNTMRATELNEKQMNELAVSAIKIRKGLPMESEVKVDDETITDLLEPKREEDKGNDLWSVFNRLQEKIIKGGATISVDGKKARKMRGIKSAIKDLKINEQLFSTAYAYAA